jgi:E3 ubiquitin-protein ligase RHA2
MLLARSFLFFSSEEEEFAEAQSESMDCCTQTPAPILNNPGSVLVSVETQSEEDVCNICLENEGAIVKIAKCGHIFHRSCIEKWLRECKATCPVCHADLS